MRRKRQCVSEDMKDKHYIPRSLILSVSHWPNIPRSKTLYPYLRPYIPRSINPILGLRPYFLGFLPYIFIFWTFSLNLISLGLEPNIGLIIINRRPYILGFWTQVVFINGKLSYLQICSSTGKFVLDAINSMCVNLNFPCLPSVCS